MSTSRVLLAVLLSYSAAQAADYKLLKTIPIGGEGGWDYAYADAHSRKLFLSHATHVVVMDMDTEKVVGDIPDTPGVHGIAISPSGKGFISDGRANRVDFFDVKTLAKTGSTPAGTNPDAITYDPVSDRVFAFGGRSKDAIAIGAESGKVDATIPLGGKPETGVPDGNGHVYVNIEDTGEIAEIDTKGLTVTRRFKVEGCEEPSGLSIDQKRHRLFAGCGNKVMVVLDFVSGKTIGSAPIGEGVDACDFDPGTGLAFASTGDGHLTVVQENDGKFSVVQNLETQKGARTSTLDEKTHRVYLPDAKMNDAPAATAANPHPRPSMVPDSFMVLVVGK